jgi:hypothetical protein
MTYKFVNKHDEESSVPKFGYRKIDEQGRWANSYHRRKRIMRDFRVLFSKRTFFRLAKVLGYEILDQKDAAPKDGK